MDELNAEVAEIDEVPEALRALYHRNGEEGPYRLRVRGVEFPDQTEGLKSALKKERDRNRALSDQIRAIPQDFDADLWRQLLELRDRVEAGAGPGGKDGDGAPADKFDAVRKRIEDRYSAQVKEKETRIEAMNGFVRGLLVDRALSEALSGAGVLPQYMEAVKALLERRGRPEVVEDSAEVFRAVVQTDTGELSIRDWVDEWARTNEAAVYLPPSGKSGGGSPADNPGGGGRSNPWAATSFNLTEQGRIMRENPEQARRLRAAAGMG
jgi:hypothetical protein